MFSLICAWINAWVNDRESGDLRRRHFPRHITALRGTLTNRLILACNMLHPTYLWDWIRLEYFAKFKSHYKYREMISKFCLHVTLLASFTLLFIHFSIKGGHILDWWTMNYNNNNITVLLLMSPLYFNENCFTILTKMGEVCLFFELNMGLNRNCHPSTNSINFVTTQSIQINITVVQPSLKSS